MYAVVVAAAAAVIVVIVLLLGGSLRCGVRGTGYGVGCFIRMVWVCGCVCVGVCVFGK